MVDMEAEEEGEEDEAGGEVDVVVEEGGVDVVEGGVGDSQQSIYVMSYSKRELWQPQGKRLSRGGIMMQ